MLIQQPNPTPQQIAMRLDQQISDRVYGLTEEWVPDSYVKWLFGCKTRYLSNIEDDLKSDDVRRYGGKKRGNRIWRKKAILEKHKSGMSNQIKSN